MTATRRTKRTKRTAAKAGLGQRLTAALPWMLAALSLSLMLTGVIYMPRMLEAWPLSEVRVEGVTDERRQKAVRVTLSDMLVDENFFSVPLRGIHDRVVELPWVAGARVRRDWPDRLVLRVEERVPVAVWNDDTLVSSGGEPFHALDKYATDALPRLSGPGHRLADVMDYYHSMDKLLADVDMGIRSMAVDARLTARLELHNGVELVVDRDGYESKLRRFVRLYDRVLSTDTRVLARVDLRYADGMAVQWHDTGAKPARKERV